MPSARSARFSCPPPKRAPERRPISVCRNADRPDQQALPGDREVRNWNGPRPRKFIEHSSSAHRAFIFGCLSAGIKAANTRPRAPRPVLWGPQRGG